MEQQFYREELGVTAPFIVENGGAIYVPKDYFRLPFNYDKALPDYLVIEFGIPRSELRHRLNPILDAACRKIEANPRVGGIAINSFDNMTTEEIAKETGLSLKLAALAKQREYSETLKIEGDRRAIELGEINNAGLLAIHGGQFYEVTGGNNKERAARVLLEMYKLNYGGIVSFGIGDGIADIPFLNHVDYPMLVQNADKRWQRLEIRNLARVKGIGPEGWSRAIDLLLTYP
jgi:mannosyl-3-phosphoglycerate synthase